ncbi:hypothetical protein TRVA0_007S03356 [Trichomonascus vanleenenianus]|uniref:uncharacterized protein n=1 Tax=Trichomonascus vanleenenianus TaxID=2268995 RepID=UPI003ECA0C5D
MNGGRSVINGGGPRVKQTYRRAHSQPYKDTEEERRRKAAEEENERELQRRKKEEERKSKTKKFRDKLASEQSALDHFREQSNQLLEEHGDEDFDAMLEQIDEDARSKRKSKEEIIKEGRKQGYPEKLNERLIVEVSKSIVPEIKHILLRKEKHVFRDSAQKLSQSSKRPRLVMADLEFPPLGYYGQAGFALILDTLPSSVDTMVDKIRMSEKWLGKFATSFLVLRLVIYPEIMARVIRRENKCSYNRALEILRESDPYGMAYFGDGQSRNSTVHLSSDDELGDEGDFSIEEPGTRSKDNDKSIVTTVVDDDDDDDDEIPASYIPEMVSSPEHSDDEIERLSPASLSAKEEPAEEPRSSTYYFSDDDL